MKWHWTLLVVLSVPSLAGASPRDHRQVALYESFGSYDQRVADVGYRLATRNVGWCPDAHPTTGLTLSDIALYPEGARDAVDVAYGRTGDAPIFIGAVARDSPAAVAGLARGHAIETIDGVAVTGLGGGKAGYARMAAIDAGTPDWLADGSLEVRLAGDLEARKIGSSLACVSIFQVTADDEVGGSADGRYVKISAAAVAFARDDAELATLMAHELAHNILKHRARLDAHGRSARRVRDTEIEADRMAVWLLNHAGYDPESAIRFYERIRKEKGDGLIASATHGRTSTRIKAIKAEIAAMRAVLAADPNARPPMLVTPLPR